MGDKCSGHKDDSFVLLEDGKNNAKENFSNCDNNPQMTRWPSENNNAAATRSYEANSESADNHVNNDNDSMFSQENKNWAVHAVVHSNVENMQSSIISLRSLTRSPIVTTTATTRNNDNNR